MTETSEEIWFVLLQGEELGPLSFEDVLDFYYKDVINSDTLIWRDGFDNWLPILHVPAFNDLLFQGVIIDEPSGPRGEDTAFVDHSALNAALLAPSSSTNGENGESSLEELDLEELEPIESIEPIEPIDDEYSPSLQKHIEAPQLQLKAPPKQKSSSKGGLVLVLILLIGGGLFTLKPWDRPTDKVNDQSEVNSTPVKQTLSHSGSSIDLPKADQSTTANDELASAPAEMVAQVELAQDAALKLPQAEQIEVADQGIVIRDPQTLQAGIEEVDIFDNEIEIETLIEVDPVKPSEEKQSSQSSTKSKVRRPTKLKNKKSKRAKRKPSKAAPPQKESTAKAKSEKVLVTLRRGDYERVLKKSRSSFQSCLASDKELSGTVNVMVVIERSGSVSSARPTSSKLRKSEASNCIIKVVKGLKFPAYSGDLLRVPLPIKL